LTLSRNKASIADEINTVADLTTTCGRQKITPLKRFYNFPLYSIEAF